MIRKLFVVLMLLVLLPAVLSIDSDNDGVSDTNDPFPLDSARVGITDGTDNFDSITISKVSELYDDFDNLKLVNGDRDRLDIATVDNQEDADNTVLLTWNNPASNSPNSWSKSLFSEAEDDNYNIMDAALISPRNEVTVIYAKDGTSYKIKSRSQEKFHRRARGKTHLSDSESDSGSATQSDYTSEDCSIATDPYCESVEYYIKDINIVNLDSDTNPELVLITEPYKFTNDGDERIHQHKNYILIFKGTGDNALFEEVPTLYKIPKVIADITFLDKNSFIYVQDLYSPDLIKYNNFNYVDNPQSWDLLQAVDLSDDLNDVSKTITSYDTVKEIYDVSSEYILGRDYYENSLLVYDHDISLVKKIEIDSSRSKDVEDAKFGLMDNDDIIDIVIAEECQNTYHKNLQIWYGDENEEFTKQEVDNDDIKCVKDLAVGDIDRDGDHDILFTSIYTFNPSTLEYLNWLENPGTPVEAPPTIDDLDNDGVEDASDDCPNTLDGADVNLVGCPDADQDGIKDDEDQCQNTPEGIPVDSTGCATTQTDADGDGISDAEDKCPDENPGIFDQYRGRRQEGQMLVSGSSGTADGCIDDSDSDDVLENIDLCPNTLAGEEVDGIGCGIGQSAIVMSSNTKVGVPITGIIRNLGENINGALSYFDKEIEIVYWFNGLKENKEIINDAGNFICGESTEDEYACDVYTGNRVDIIINYTTSDNIVEEGLACSCAKIGEFGDYESTLPMKFKINPLGISTQASITETFINTYNSLDECDLPEIVETEEEESAETVQESSTCRVNAMIFYEDGTDTLLESNSFPLYTKDTPDEDLSIPINEEGEESPFGVYSQSCEYGNTGERIDGSEWCCISGYVAKDVGVLSSLNPGEEACLLYENREPNAVISTNVTNISLGETIIFDASSSKDSDGIIKEYIWTFGDGSPQETGETVEHKYENACEENACIITLIVKDNFNNIGEENITLNMTNIIIAETSTNVTEDTNVTTEKKETKKEDKKPTESGYKYDFDKKKPEEKGSAAGWIIIIALLALIGGGYYAFKKGLFTKKPAPETTDFGAEPETTEAPKESPKGDTSSFISEQKSQGLSNEQIRQKLLGKGLSDEEVDKHMNKSRE